MRTMVPSPRRCRCLILLSIVCATIPCTASAQSSTEFRKAAEFRAGDRTFEGEIRWNPADKKLSLFDSTGKETAWPEELAFADRTQDRPAPIVAERPDEAVVIFGPRERISGRIRSVTADGKAAFEFGDEGVSVEVPVSSAYAWLLNPTKSVALFRDFRTASPAPEPRTPGTSAMSLTGEKAETVELQGVMSSDRCLVQLAFVESESQSDNAPLSLRFVDRSNDRPIEVTLRTESDIWAVSLASGDEKTEARLPRSVGLHHLGVLFGDDRIRLCLDESVPVSLRSESGISRVPSVIRIATPPDQARGVVSLGVYCYGPTGALFQRSRLVDTLQLVGGHEWLCRVDGLKNDRWSVSDGATVHELPVHVVRTWLPRFRPESAVWALGPVYEVAWRRPGGTVWAVGSDRIPWESVGLPDPPAFDLDRVEGAVESVSDEGLTLRLSQGPTLKIPFDAVVSLRPAGASGVLVVDSGRHHLGDEIDSRLIPPDPVGRSLTLNFVLNDEQARWPMVLALDVIEVLGRESSRFADLIRQGEMITQAKINGTVVGTLNDKVSADNLTLERIRFEIPPGTVKAGANSVEFSQVGRKKDPNYLDDLGLFGVRLYRSP